MDPAYAYLNQPLLGPLKDKKKALEVPGSCLEPESRRMIEQTLVELYDAPVSINDDVLSDFLHACLQVSSRVKE